MGVALAKAKRLEKRYGVTTEGAKDPDKREQELNCLPYEDRKKFWHQELYIMFFENLLFLAFVHGMTPGLEDRRSIK